MSSRQEEKERRRRERQEREQAERQKATSKRRLQLVAGAVLAIAAVAAVIVAIAAGGSDNKGAQSGDKLAKAPIPARKISDFNAAVKAAGCTFKTYPSEGRGHLPSDTATNDKYKTNPPTSGDHRPTPAQDGVYAPNNAPAKENAVHALEHGRIEIEYAPGTPTKVREQLNTLFNENLKGVPGYHQLLFQNNTKMPYQIAAVAWTHLLGCNTMNPQVFDAIRAFRDRFVDKGPELIP